MQHLTATNFVGLISSSALLAGMALATLTGDEQQTEQQRRMKSKQLQNSSKSSAPSGKKTSSSQMFGMQPSRRRSGSQCENLEECLVDDGKFDEAADLSNIDLEGTTFTTSDILEPNSRQAGLTTAQKRCDEEGLEGPRQRTTLVPQQQAEPRDAEIVQDDRPVWSIRRALTV